MPGHATAIASHDGDGDEHHRFSREGRDFGLHNFEAQGDSRARSQLHSQQTPAETLGISEGGRYDHDALSPSGEALDSFDMDDLEGRLPHIPLRRYRNQVGGHSAIYKFTGRAVCKVGFSRVLFYAVPTPRFALPWTLYAASAWLDFFSTSTFVAYGACYIHSEHVMSY